MLRSLNLTTSTIARQKLPRRPIVMFQEGNILGEPPHRQYRLMHKLGWGSYSTVWLAQTIDEPDTFVALKITTAEDEDIQTHEVEMLQKATKGQPDDQSYSHVANLLDHFKLRGPNGTHTVIVTDVVVPILSLPTQPPAWRKAAAYGVAQAMAQLHTSKIVHGDWHLGNIGIAMPQLANRDSCDVMRNLSAPQASVVLTEDVAKQTASLPAYLTFSCDIGTYYQQIAGSDPPQMKIFDFGTAHEFGRHPRVFQCATEACAPEVAFAHIFQEIDNPNFDPPADIWALGTSVEFSIYEIVTGGPFYRESIDTLPLDACKIAGRVPPHWEEWAATQSGSTINQADAENHWAEEWGIIRDGCESDEDTDALIRLLKTVFVPDPAERPTAAQIVSDPWFRCVSGAKDIAPARPSQM